MAEQPTSTMLAPLAAADIVEGEALPIVPMFGAAEMTQAFEAYRELQAALDHAMPDQLIEVGDRKFRKKGYWRAVGVAFHLTVKPVSEVRDVDGAFADGRENFGYLVTYVARSGTREMSGDGACFAVEKAEKYRCPHPHPTVDWKTLHYPQESCPDFDPEFRWRALPSQATVHNVRSHAHTRAFNRAVSNLVGFGEVSAEEVDRDDERDEPGQSRPPASTTPQQRSSGGPSVISEPQRKRMYAIAKGAGWTDEEIKACLKRHGFEHAAEVTRDKYERICGELEGGTR